MRKLHLLVLTVFALAFPATGKAQLSATLGEQNVMDMRGNFTPTITMYVTGKLASKAGVMAWGLVSEEWSEGILGGFYAPKSWIQLDLGFGIESDPKPFRTMGSVYLGNSRGSFYACIESGGSGPWYLFEGNIGFDLDKARAGLGFRAQRFVGVGPRIEVALKKVALWASPVMWDVEYDGEKRGMVGMRITP
jgi:hypothetical protein